MRHSRQQGDSLKKSEPRLRASVAIGAILLFLASPGFAQDSLSLLREEVRTPHNPLPPPATAPSNIPPPPPPTSPSPSGNAQGAAAAPHEEEEAWEDFTSGLIGPIFLGTTYVVTAPIWAPISLLEDNYDVAGYFPRYPYYKDLEGGMMIDPNTPYKTRDWSFRARKEFGYDFKGGERGTGHFLFDTKYRFGFDWDTTYRFQNIAAGLPDDIWTGDFNALFRFAQSEKWQLRPGVGTNYMFDSHIWKFTNHKSDFGYNVTYATDWFPKKPIVISTEVDLGTLGHASLIHGRASAGYLWRRFEFFAAYDLFRVGRFDQDTLGLGLRVWH